MVPTQTVLSKDGRKFLLDVKFQILNNPLIHINHTVYLQSYAPNQSYQILESEVPPCELNTSACVWLQTGAINRCEVCAIGSLLLTDILLHNECSVSEFVNLSQTLMHYSPDVVKRVTKYVDPVTLAYMECAIMAFDTDSMVFFTATGQYPVSRDCVPDKERLQHIATVTRDWTTRVKNKCPGISQRDLLINIINNILRNGCFSPLDKRVTRPRDIKRVRKPAQVLPPVQYGERYMVDGDEYVVANTESEHSPTTCVMLINVKSGNRYRDPVQLPHGTMPTIRDLINKPGISYWKL